jgi:hypothetical protein
LGKAVQFITLGIRVESSWNYARETNIFAYNFNLHLYNSDAGDSFVGYGGTTKTLAIRLTLTDGFVIPDVVAVGLTSVFLSITSDNPLAVSVTDEVRRYKL